MQSYKHFTLEERESLQQLKREGKSDSEIAVMLKRNRSSIGRELKRNSNRDGSYHPWRATSLYMDRRKKCGRKYVLLRDEPLHTYVLRRLKLGHSPECIVGRYKKENHGAKLSFSTIYRAIERGILPGITAKEHLRRRGKGRYGSRSKFNTNTIQPDRTIHERPDKASSRTRVGDWEGDTLVGGKGCVFTAVDRKTRYLTAAVSRSQSSDAVKAAAKVAIGSMPRYTLTLDNGSEFAKHRELASELGIDIYFADPRSPWQRGTNENTNGLLRYYYPKGTDFLKVNVADLDLIVSLLNDRPRKCLDWLSPREVFLATCCT